MVKTNTINCNRVIYQIAALGVLAVTVLGFCQPTSLVSRENCNTAKPALKQLVILGLFAGGEFRLSPMLFSYGPNLIIIRDEGQTFAHYRWKVDISYSLEAAYQGLRGLFFKASLADELAEFAVKYGGRQAETTYTAVSFSAFLEGGCGPEWEIRWDHDGTPLIYKLNIVDQNLSKDVSNKVSFSWCPIEDTELSPEQENNLPIADEASLNNSDPGEQVADQSSSYDYPVPDLTSLDKSDAGEQVADQSSSYDYPVPDLTSLDKSDTSHQVTDSIRSQYAPQMQLVQQLPVPSLSPPPHYSPTGFELTTFEVILRLLLFFGFIIFK